MACSPEKRLRQTGGARGNGEHERQTLGGAAKLTLPQRIGKAERKYLEQHAAPEAKLVERLPNSPEAYGHVLAIPAYGESVDLRLVLSTLPAGCQGDVLIVLVVNEGPGAPDWARRANRQVLATLRENHALVYRLSEHAELLAHPRGSLLLLDRTLPDSGLPPRQGVGLARKIGADFALALWAAGRLHSPWIHCTDADVVLPADYFHQVEAAVPSTDRVACRLYAYRHRVDPDAESAEAILRYEISLRYYVLGLRSAGSPYAYQTLGSILAIDPTAYAQVRGFPRRLAGEDFHLLNKLAKVGAIEALHGAAVELSGRVSERVPFGTGAAMKRALQREAGGEPFPLYDPRVFAGLRVWLLTLERLGREQEDHDSCVRTAFDRVAASDPEIDAAALFSSLEELGEVRATEKILQRGGQRGALERHLHEHCDALRSLKIMHALRDRVWPSLPMQEALSRAPFLDPACTQTGDLGELRDHLARCESDPPTARGVLATRC